jgi:uncharacterized membrane protein YhiD involved in acid resistance
MTDIFASIFDTVSGMGPVEFLTCVGSALAIGFAISAIYSFRNKHSKGFALTIGVLPAIVSVVIMAVSGDIGAGIAVAGAFSLVRFRSAPGSAKEIAVIFLAMACGLLIGMGLVAYSAIFAAIVCAVILMFSVFRKEADGSETKMVKITVPEDLDFTTEIDPIISECTESMELVEVKSVNMGSMFRLTYDVRFREDADQKAMIDKVRIRNGNLEVAVVRKDFAESRGL